MSERPSDQERLLSLISEVMDGSLDPEGRDELNSLLKASAEARRLYREHMELHARLHLDYAGGTVLPEMPELTDMPVRASGPAAPRPTTAFPSRSGLAWWKGIAAALVAALLVNAVILWQRDNSMTGRLGIGGAAEGVAVLSRAVSVEWAPGAPMFRAGDPLPAGRISVNAGLAQIEFFGGATVIVEGPAELDLVSAQRAVLHHGRLRASVPEPARGFTIEGPDFDAVDLGTEFAMSVSESGQSEVHVVDGEVAVHGKNHGPLLSNLTTGDGARLPGNGAPLESIESGGGAFVGREEILKLAGERWRDRKTEWLGQRDRLAADPDTLVFFDFEGHHPWDRRLSSATPGGPEGAIVGAQWTGGRWPGKQAIEFKRITDRVRIDVPEEFASITFAAWVRVEGLDRWLSSLMLTDGWDPGEPHWQISDEGEMILGISGMGNSFSPPVIGPESLGKWLFLVSVFDSEKLTVSHYVDGKQVHSESVKKAVPLRIGSAELGNWKPTEPVAETGRIRILNGRIDEFLVSRRAMTKEEIANLFRAGSPDP